MTHEDPLVFAHGFKKYEKVKRFDHKDEIQGILDSEEVCVFEKLDGANASVWFHDNQVYVASKNNIVGSMNIKTGQKHIGDFRGLPEHVFSNEAIIRHVIEYPERRLCGEWLVKHTIDYPQEFLNQFYVFDVEDDLGYMHWEDYWADLAIKGVKYLNPIMILDHPDVEDIKAVCGHTDFKARPQGEGVVCKNYGYENKYGRRVFVKMVTRDFKEVQKPKKKIGSTTPIEEQIAQRYITFARVVKIVRKIETEWIEENIRKEHTGRVIGMVYHDLITEEMWDILKRFKSATINFGVLRNEVNTLTKQHFNTILLDG